MYLGMGRRSRAGPGGRVRRPPGMTGGYFMRRVFSVIPG